MTLSGTSDEQDTERSYHVKTLTRHPQTRGISPMRPRQHVASLRSESARRGQRQSCTESHAVERLRLRQTHTRSDERDMRSASSMMHGHPFQMRCAACAASTVKLKCMSTADAMVVARMPARLALTVAASVSKHKTHAPDLAACGAHGMHAIAPLAPHSRGLCSPRDTPTPAIST